MGKSLDVNTSGGNISCDENLKFLILESMNNLFPLVLRDVSVESIAGKAIMNQLMVDLVRLYFGDKNTAKVGFA